MSDPRIVTLTADECGALGIANDPDNLIKINVERVVAERVTRALAPIQDLADERGDDEALDEALGFEG